MRKRRGRKSKRRIKITWGKSNKDEEEEESVVEEEEEERKTWRIRIRK